MFVAFMQLLTVYSFFDLGIFFSLLVNLVATTLDRFFVPAEVRCLPNVLFVVGRDRRRSFSIKSGYLSFTLFSNGSYVSDSESGLLGSRKYSPVATLLISLEQRQILRRCFKPLFFSATQKTRFTAMTATLVFKTTWSPSTF